MPWHLMPTRATYKYHFLFSSSSPSLCLAPSSLSHCRITVQTKYCLSLSILIFINKNPFITTCNQSVAGRHPTSLAKMQFTLLTLVTLFAAAIAAPLKGEEDCEYYTRERKNRLPSARILTMIFLVVVKRQAAAGQPTTSQPAMSAQDGSIVAFNTAGVYLDSVAKGL